MPPHECPIAAKAVPCGTMREVWARATPVVARSIATALDAITDLCLTDLMACSPARFAVGRRLLPPGFRVNRPPKGRLPRAQQDDRDVALRSGLVAVVVRPLRGHDRPYAPFLGRCR